MADSISPAEALTAYCNVLLRSEGRARMPWNSGLRFPVKSNAVWAEAEIPDRASTTIGARAPAYRRQNARLAWIFKTSPPPAFADPAAIGRALSMVLFSARFRGVLAA